MRVAVIDMGTNSTRLFIAESDEDSFVRPVHRITDITGLGKGIGSDGCVTPEAIARTTAVLEKYAKIIAEHNVVFVRAAATAAMRAAANAETVLDGFEEILGSRPKIISGEREAELTFYGALSDPLISHMGLEFQVIDVGGGSTEISLGFRKPRISKSLALGCVTLKEAFLKSDPPTDTERGEARAHVEQVLAAEFDPGPIRGAIAIAVAGTATSLAAIELELEPYNPDQIHRFRLNAETVLRQMEALAAQPLADRRDVVGLEAQRAEHIVSGALILAVIMDYFKFPEVIVSERDILDGLALTAVADYNRRR